MKTKTDPTAAAAGSPLASPGEAPRWLEVVRDRVGHLRYGVVQVVVHDGRVTQIESTERVRFSADLAPAERG